MKTKDIIILHNNHKTGGKHIVGFIIVNEDNKIAVIGLDGHWECDKAFFQEFDSYEDLVKWTADTNQAFWNTYRNNGGYVSIGLRKKFRRSGIIKDIAVNRGVRNILKDGILNSRSFCLVKDLNEGIEYLKNDQLNRSKALNNLTHSAKIAIKAFEKFIKNAKRN